MFHVSSLKTAKDFDPLLFTEKARQWSNMRRICSQKNKPVVIIYLSPNGHF
jgi:hypothetical protein